MGQSLMGLGELTISAKISERLARNARWIMASVAPNELRIRVRSIFFRCSVRQTRGVSLPPRICAVTGLPHRLRRLNAPSSKVIDLLRAETLS